MVNEAADWRVVLKICSDHIALCRVELVIELNMKSGFELLESVTRVYRIYIEKVRAHAKPKIASCQHSKSRDHRIGRSSSLSTLYTMSSYIKD